MATEKAIEQVKKRICNELGIKYVKRIKSKRYTIGMPKDFDSKLNN